MALQSRIWECRERRIRPIGRSDKALLGLGLRYLFRYARDTSAITAKEHDALWARGWRALKTAVADQAAHQRDSDPVARFITLITSALARGTAHVATENGQEPEPPGAWGWREHKVGVDYVCQSSGLRIGWLKDGQLYLERDAAFNVAQQLAREGGDALPISAAALAKRLHEKGLLVNTEYAKRKVLTVRRRLDGARREVLNLDITALQPPDPGSHPTSSPAQLTTATSDSTTAEPDTTRPETQPGRTGQVQEQLHDEET